MEEKKVGTVTHYYTHLGVGIIKIEAEGLKIGDQVHFKGHTTDFQQSITSLQIEHQSVQEAKVGDHVGLKVDQHVRENDEVLKVIA